MNAKRFLFGIGALLFAALVILSLFGNSSAAGHARKGLVLGIAVAVGSLGVVIFPTRPCKRPIVKRGLLIGASVGLVLCAGLLLLNGWHCAGLLTLIFGGHAGLGTGISLASATVALPEDMVYEFQSILRGLLPHKQLLDGLPDRLKSLERENTSLQTELNKIRKMQLASGLGTGVRWIGDKPFVTDDCARALTSVLVVDCGRLGDKGLETMIPDKSNRERIFTMACANLGMETRAAMTATEIPLPTVYVPQVVELVWKYGQARQYATVFPLGAGTVKLPRLKAGEDDFGYFGAGTAGMSQAITEKKVTAELVTFTANKAGGLIRLPFELEEDTFIPIGQFLARYIGRQLAKLEDKTLFLADGSGTYAGQTGIGPYCAANPTYLLQLGAGKTKPSDATLADFRNLRSKVSPAILAGGFDAAYYLSATFEPMLRSFNAYPQFVVYENVNGKPTFDGWPVRWIGVSQAYSTAAAASSYLAFFGALNYWYLGERGQPRVEFSRDVFFATDELAMRALERIDVEALAIDGMSALQTAAA